MAFGLILGAQLPDVCEGVIGWTPWGTRVSVLAHRGVSHSPIPWALACIAAMLATAAFAHEHPGNDARAWFCALLTGSIAGALLHIGIDAFSPSGVPTLPGQPRASFGPWGRRGARYVYRTGTLEEWRLLLPLLLFAIAVTAWRVAGLALTLRPS
jgi:membrane-bound metal-dependent hydrolase YbcI (DUF457 family)